MESERKHIFHLSGKRFSLDDEEWTKKMQQDSINWEKLRSSNYQNQLSSCRFNSD